MGVLAATAARHARAHFRPHPAEVERPHAAPQAAHLPPAVREHLLEVAQAKFQAILDHQAIELQHDLATTGSKLNKLLEKLGTDIVGSEAERFHTAVDKLRLQAETDIGGAQTEVVAHQAALKAQLAEEMTAERRRLTQQIDTKLADAVASFLLETLQHNVDLGSQSAYLTAMLEEHKADFSRELAE